MAQVSEFFYCGRELMLKPNKAGLFEGIFFWGGGGYIFRKTTEGGGVKLTSPSPPAVLGLRSNNKIFEGHNNRECYKSEKI